MSNIASSSPHCPKHADQRLPCAICESEKHEQSTLDQDRLMWIAIRSGLVVILEAIERRHKLGKYKKA